MEGMIVNKINEYKPCRTIECFQDLDGTVEIMSKKGPVKLKGAVRILWLMANGKHTLGDIVDVIYDYMKVEQKESVVLMISKILVQLKNRGLMVINWDPLYKFDLCQELK